MSRSRKKNPITAITHAESEKQDKRLANRRLRRRNRELIQQHTGEEDVPQLELKEISDIWKFDKDGKQWCDPEEFPEVTRK